MGIMQLNEAQKSRNTYNNIKQLTTGSNELTSSQQKLKTISHNNNNDQNGEFHRDLRNDNKNRFNTIE